MKNFNCNPAFCHEEMAWRKVIEEYRSALRHMIKYYDYDAGNNSLTWTKQDWMRIVKIRKLAE